MTSVETASEPAKQAASHAATAGPALHRMQVLIVSLLLFMATIHCTMSIFWVNYSYLNLKQYAAGTGAMPYQGRIGMVPVLRMAEDSPRFVALAHAIDANRQAKFKRYTIETISPEKLASILAGLASLLAAVGVLAYYGFRRFPAMWFLPPVLLLAMLYATQAARYEVTLWYPYDLPHLFLFGSACLLILEGAWVPAVLLFLVDLPVRETALFLAVVSLAVGYARGERARGIAAAAVMAAAWIPFRLYIVHRFAANVGNEAGIHVENLRNVLNPTHWPQMLSGFGFLLVPLWLSRRWLSTAQRAFLLGMVPCLLVTLAYGVWAESRIFNEWLMPAAVLLASEAYHRFGGGMPRLAVEMQAHGS